MAWVAALAAGAGASELPANFVLDGPEAPQPPAVLNRDPAGRATVRATRISEPLRVDGALDERAYQTVPAIDGFVQQEPHEGQPISERTEAWVFFDAENVYVAARLHDSEPERRVANELRRDHFGLFENENFGVIFDTFYDRRNGFFFYTNPLGAIADQVVTDERDSNRDWNTVWQVKTGRFDQGWTVEMAIPFKSLRYGRVPVWGINLRRRIRWKNELAYLTPIPASVGRRGMNKLSSAATLVGLELPSTSRNLELKPYSIAGLRTDRDAEPPLSNDREADAGFDLKYGLSKSLTLDATLNTDFAQVEDDLQQVNLSRFSVLFPEKREFFLEGQGLFSFGGAGNDRFAGPSRSPIVFFSRQIGLYEDRAIPIVAGGRITGKAGPYGIGVLDIKTGQDEAVDLAGTHFSVARVKRDVLRRSTIGVIATRRSPSVNGPGVNTVAGADASFSLSENTRLFGYYAASDTPGREGAETSHLAKFDYSGDRYGLQAERLAVGENFNPEVGFLPRAGFLRHFAQARFSPRPKRLAGIRKISWEASFDNITDGHGFLETREARFQTGLEFHNGDSLELEVARNTEAFVEDFELLPELFVAPGRYEYDAARLMFRLGNQRRLSGFVWLGAGEFYDGQRTEAGWEGLVEVSPRLSIEPRVMVNWVDLPAFRVTTQLYGGRLNWMIGPRTFAGALVQYNSTTATLATNLRFRWEYRPGSELFVVYSDGRETGLGGYPALRSRSFVVKATRLFRF